MDVGKLTNLNILSVCHCDICNLFHGQRLIYNIFKTRFYVRVIDDSASYWIGCPRNIKSEQTHLEDIVPALSQDDQTILFFNINLFTKGGA
jgi:hypothetical protein